MHKLRGISRIASAIAMLAIAKPAATFAAVLECERLSQLQLRDVRITATTPIVPSPTWQSPPNFTTQNRPVAVGTAFCRVELIIEKEIAAEVWLPPRSAWNGRYLGVGNGGDAGFINYQDLARGIGRGFASASTDTGHQRTDAHWGLGHPDRVENFTHRAHHLLAVTAKEIVARYYAKPADRAYFMGCSGGGSQGLMLAQRYPNDYDGIMAGAGGVGMLPLSTRMLWTALNLEQRPEARLTDAQWSAIADTALRQCDKQDGVEDGVVEQPAACRVDVAQFACATSASPTCLQPAQVESLRDVMAPLRQANGREIDPGFPAGIRYSPTSRQINIAGTLFGDWTYQDATWDVRGFALDRDVPAARKRWPLLEYDRPDLRAFSRRGGKLIAYQGWLDPTVPPLLTVRFYEQAAAKLRGNSNQTLRLFMVPGMEHCTRGPGPESFGQAFRGDAPVIDADHDLLTALMAWVEQGKAPDRIVASRVRDDKVDRTRPLCPYPSVARYDGSGSTDAAENFSCVKPTAPPVK